MNKQIESFLLQEGIGFETQVDLKKKTWIHRGGIADFFVIPENVSLLQKTMTFLYQYNIRHLVIGCTSNLYILNTTNIPVVVSTLKCDSFTVKENIIECDCGVQVGKLARQMIENGIKGFEYLTKLPGTVAAAIYNNSTVKCQQNSIVELLINLDLLTQNGLVTIKAEDLHFSFRSSDIKKHILQGIILRARLKKRVGDVEMMSKIAKCNEKEREELLDSPAKNLGCTVHREFCNGPMPFKYKLLSWVYSKVLLMFVRNRLKRTRLFKEFILTISRHKRLIPYVSDKNMITFIWKDEKADEVFEEYLQFMREIYKTDKVEIEIV